MTVTVKGFIKKLAGFSVASWFSAGISFLVTPVFTRLYLPDDIGHINLFMTYVTFFQTLSVLALDQAFMRFYNEDLPGLTKQNFLLKNQHDHCVYKRVDRSFWVPVFFSSGFRN